MTLLFFLLYYSFKPFNAFQSHNAMIYKAKNQTMGKLLWSMGKFLWSAGKLLWSAGGSFYGKKGKLLWSEGSFYGDLSTA
jgi:hypothetical protein